MKNEQIKITVTDLDKQDQIESLMKQINDMSESQLVELNNVYCHKIGADDQEIYNNDEEFFEMMFKDAMSAVRAVSFGTYEYSADYVRFNGYGNLETIRYIRPDDLCELPATIAEYALENQSEFEGILDFNFESNEE